MKTNIKHSKPTLASYFTDSMQQDMGKDPETVLEKMYKLVGRSSGGLSEYWRVNTSHMESAELANALRALRKVAGLLGENVGRIEWAGMSQDGKAKITLDPGLVLGQYPIPSGKFDYLVGLVTHEAFHKIEWTEYMWNKLSNDMSKMKFGDKMRLQKIIYIGEDIYVDKISERFIFGLYVPEARQVGMKIYKAPLKLKSITYEELLYIWWVSSFKQNNISLDSLEKIKVYQPLLDILQDLTDELKKLGNSSKGVSYRCDERINLYLNYWDKLKDALYPLEVSDKTLMWFPSSIISGKEEKDDKKKKKGKKLSENTARNIETMLAYDSTDITPIIQSVVQGEDDVIPTSRWDFNIPSHPVIDRKLVGRLKTIFQDYAERKTLVSRGLASGKIDKRRLYRAPVSERCFKDIQKIPVLDWNICLLIDGSGSMSGPRWQMVENTLATIYMAFKGFQNRLQAYGYFEVEDVCLISSLIKDRNLLSVPPSGHTASGQALIAAAHFMPKDGNRRFLIHITDGDANYGCAVKYGIDYCRQRRVQLITLGVGCKDRGAMTEQYGGALQFLDHFGQLPKALESLFKRTILYGKVPTKIDFEKKEKNLIL